MANLAKILAAIDELSVKERLLLTCALMLVLVFVANRLLLRPLDNDRQQLTKAIASKREEIEVLQRQEQALLNAATQDPDAENRALLQDLRMQLASMQRQFAGTAEHLIAPDKIPEMLRTVLDKSKGLQLVRLEGLGVKPLVAESQVPAGGSGEKSKTADIAAYRHSVRIDIEGSYLNLLQYLREVEALPWTLYWDSAELQVTEHPRAVLSVVVNTLSLSEAWIGT
jgi:MSHA biogenesis protein MshJ